MLHLGDIAKISGYTAPIVDCIIGGSPCQDLSVAGRRAGLDGERSGLFMEQNLYRIYTLRDLGYDPYVMVYDKPNAPKEIKDLQRWCNNRFIFRSCENFEDYKKKE